MADLEVIDSELNARNLLRITADLRELISIQEEAQEEVDSTQAKVRSGGPTASLERRLKHEIRPVFGMHKSRSRHVSHWQLHRGSDQVLSESTKHNCNQRPTGFPRHVHRREFDQHSGRISGLCSRCQCLIVYRYPRGSGKSCQIITRRTHVQNYQHPASNTACRQTSLQIPQAGLTTEQCDFWPVVRSCVHLHLLKSPPAMSSLLQARTTRIRAPRLHRILLKSWTRPVSQIHRLCAPTSPNKAYGSSSSECGHGICTRSQEFG